MEINEINELSVEGRRRGILRHCHVLGIRTGALETEMVWLEYVSLICFPFPEMEKTVTSVLSFVAQLGRCSREEDYLVDTNHIKVTTHIPRKKIHHLRPLPFSPFSPHYDGTCFGCAAPCLLLCV